MRNSSAKTAKYFNKHKTIFIDKTIDFKDFKIHYIETGNILKPTLLFVHGSPGSWNAFEKYLKDTLLLSKFRILAIDRPGFGFSDFGQAQNLAIQSNRILQFIDSLKIKKPISLIGHSLGGPLILQMAIDKPNAFANLVVIAGAVDPDLENPENWRPILIAKPLRYLVPGALRPANEELWWLKNDLKLMKTNLKKVVTKVTIIHGNNDRLVPYQNMRFMQLNLENSIKVDSLTIKKGDHFIPWSHYDIVRDKLLKLE